MNTDAATVLLWLRTQDVRRLAATISRVTEIPRPRVDGALMLLRAIGKIEKDGPGWLAVR